MSIKTDFEKILKEAAKKCDEAKMQVLAVCLSSDYTESGKRNASASIQKNLREYLDRQKAAVNNAVNDRCDNLAAFEDLQLKEKNESADYQSLLSSTLSMLPDIADSMALDYLKKRLEPFEDDPLAISAIEKVLKRIASEKKNVQDTMAILSVIPANNRGRKAERLQKLQKTMLQHLDNMAVSVGENAFTSSSELAVSGAIGGGSIISATLDYINACADDDCTVFENAYLQDGQSESVKFDFGFKHIN